MIMLSKMTILCWAIRVTCSKAKYTLFPVFSAFLVINFCSRHSEIVRVKTDTCVRTVKSEQTFQCWCLEIRDGHIREVV